MVHSTRRTVILFASLLFVANCGWVEGGAPERELTTSEATALLKSALEGYGTTALPGFSLEYEERGSNSRFYAFTGYWKNPSPGSVVTGSYDVDRQTGDIWWGDICKEIDPPGFEEKKRQLRKVIGLSDDRYQELRISGRMC
jgi:hypothetical protein